MTIAPITSTPFTLTDAYVELDGHTIECVVNHLKLAPEVTKETATSICGATDYVGAVKWLLGLKLYQGFQGGDTSVFGLLSSAWDGGVPIAYVIRPHQAAASPDSPEFTGLAIPEPATIFDSDAGTLVEVEIEWACTGPPMVDTGTGSTRRARVSDAVDTSKAA